MTSINLSRIINMDDNNSELRRKAECYYMNTGKVY